MNERLQKFLARAGVASRRAAEEFIRAGRVQVNNKTVRELGTKVDPEADLVTVDGKLTTAPDDKAYYLLYKPPGVVTTLQDPQGRPTVGHLTAGLGRRVFPVGRLDFDAEGALLLTDDGELALRLTHPRYGVDRTYLAKVRGQPDAESIDRLRTGVPLEDGPARAKTVSLFERAEKNTWLCITVAEGRPHLIKRMCAAIGHPVVRLFRPAHGGIGVGSLPPGKHRPLTTHEVQQLQAVARGAPASPGTLRLPARRHGRASDTESEAREDGPPRYTRSSDSKPKAHKDAPRRAGRASDAKPKTRKDVPRRRW